MTWRKGLVLLLSAVLLVACGKKTPKATDEAHLSAPAEGKGTGANG
jgi:major membrane immunogen (membrane-anchored lipoprotein)